MKTYLIEVIRANRSERPGEAEIKADSLNLKVGNTADVTQDNSEDNWFMVQGDIQAQLMRLNAIQQHNSFWINAGDGFRVIEYPHSSKWTLDWEHLSETHTDPMEGEEVTVYAEVQVQVTTATDNRTESFMGEHAMLQAQGLIQGLNASDGWIVIQEWKRKSLVVMSRPSLWREEDYEPSYGSNNLHGRTDPDRY